jgi:hypothetical protein
MEHFKRITLLPLKHTDLLSISTKFEAKILWLMRDETFKILFSVLYHIHAPFFQSIYFWSVGNTILRDGQKGSEYSVKFM